MATATKKAPAKKAPAKKVPTKAAPAAAVKPEPVKAAPVKAEPSKALAPVKAVTPKPDEPKPGETKKPNPIQPVTVTASYQDWLNALGMAAFMSRRMVLPVLAGCTIAPSEDGVVMTATDLEIFSETIMPTAVIDGPGEVLIVRARELADVLKGIRGLQSVSAAGHEEVIVGRNADGSTIVSGFGRNLRIERDGPLPLEDFPKSPIGALRRVATLTPGGFERAFGFAVVATGRDDTLPMLTAVQMDAEASPGKMRFAATDRYRLTVFDLFANGPGSGGKGKWLVPRSAWPVLKKLHGWVNVSTQGRDRLIFRSGHLSVSVRTLDATFPSYNSLLPEGGQTWEVNRLQLIADVKAASATLERNAPVRVEFEVGKYRVAGSPLRKAPSGKEDTQSWVTSFNPQFLLEALAAFDCTMITIRGNSASKPHLLIGTTGGYSGVHLLMPVRLPG